MLLTALQDTRQGQVFLSGHTGGGTLRLIEWRGRCDERCVDDGADTFVMEDGKIVCQTIRYTVQRLNSKGSK